MSRLGAPSSSAAAFFPSARYTSLVGVHASLTVFAALFLPRTALSDVLPAPLLHLLPTPVSEPSAERGHFVDTLAAAPAATLAWLVVGIALLQVWWAGWLRAWGAEYQRERLGAAAAEDKDEARLARTGGGGLVAPESVRRVAEAGACTLVGAGALFGVLILAGAPLDSHIGHTALLAALLALLALYPPAYVLGTPFALPGAAPHAAFPARVAWTRVFAECAPAVPAERALLLPALGALAGAGAGALPLALDWERGWQRWPLPPTYGAVAGSVLGGLAACVLNSLQALADAGRAAAAQDAWEAQQKAPPVEIGKGKGRKEVRVQVAGKEAEKFEGSAAVDEMRRSVQAVLQGMKKEGDDEDEDEEGGEDEEGPSAPGKKKRRRRRGGKGVKADEAA